MGSTIISGRRHALRAGAGPGRGGPLAGSTSHHGGGYRRGERAGDESVAAPAAGPVGVSPQGGRRGRYLAPDVPETLALVTAAGTVLIACGRAEDHARPRRESASGPNDRDPAGPGAAAGVWEGSACVDPWAALEACPGWLPAPVAGKIAFAALHRVVTVLRPALHRHPDPALPGWWAPGGRAVAPLRVVELDEHDLAVLAAAADRLTRPTPALATVLDRLCPGLARGGDGLAHHWYDDDGRDDDRYDDRHPAALGCLLAVLVPVADPDTELLAALAGPRVPTPRSSDDTDDHRHGDGHGDGEGCGVRLDARGFAAHRRVTTRMTTALAGCH